MNTKNLYMFMLLFPLLVGCHNIIIFDDGASSTKEASKQSSKASSSTPQKSSSSRMGGSSNSGGFRLGGQGSSEAKPLDTSGLRKAQAIKTN